MLVIGAAWAAVQLVSPENNPITPFIFLSHPHTRLPKVDEVQKYGKGWKDVAFLSFYVIFFSFLRQSVVLYIVKPLAAMGGIKRGRKTERFTEQGYSLFYWGLASMAGLVSFGPSRCMHAGRLWLSPTMPLTHAQSLRARPPAVGHVEPANLVVQDRTVLAQLSADPDARRPQGVLPPPVLLLASAASRHGSWSRSTTKRLL
jgi:hypothetical protein